ncbi:MAG TPA: CHASE domain-containing protein [Methylomirabilota bacterium]|nr:CHASE domain-containing protein [Methylomirabilota bacterium]
MSEGPRASVSCVTVETENAVQRVGPHVHSTARARKAWLPFCVFFVTLGLTVTAAYNADLASRTRERVRFDHAVSQAEASIEAVLRRYVALIHAVRGIGAAHLNMSLDQFRAYVKALDLPKNYPGIEGLGVAVRLRPDQKEEAIRKARAKGLESFHIWPESNQSNLCPVVILEPADDHNLATLGHDLFAEPERRAAAQRAVETGEPAATGKLTLAAEAERPRGAGFLILGPLYKGGNGPDTAERSRDWSGFVYCSFSADDFFKALLNSQHNSLLNFKIYDGTQLTSANLMHDSGAETGVGSNGNALTGTNTLVVAGRTWTLLASPQRAFVAGAGVNFSPLILMAGALLSSLLAWFTAIQAKARVAAEESAALLRESEKERAALNRELEQRVIERTAELETANRELEAFSYSVSHDLRAPLRHIDSYAQILVDEAGPMLGEDNGRFLKAITKSARNMAQLIDDLLGFSRIGRMPLNTKRIDLKHLCEETIRSLEPDTGGRNIRWTVRDLPIVRGDGSMLRQVFVNLLGNAVKYTRDRSPAEIEIGCQNGKSEEDVVFVRDNGAGFDMEYADKLFGVFQRLHSREEFDGTGIGLANVNRIIGRHGGRCWAEGVVGGGATFYFSFPKAKPE